MSWGEGLHSDNGTWNGLRLDGMETDLGEEAYHEIDLALIDLEEKVA